MKLIILFTIFSIIKADPTEAECNAKKDQSSCDTLGCSWCTAGAVPPACHTIESKNESSLRRKITLTHALLTDAKQLPSAVFKCDKLMYSSDDDTALDILKNTPSLSELYTAFSSSGLTSYLEKSNLTLFAPSNDALETFPDYKLKYILQNANSLNTILKYHIVSESLSEKDLESIAASGKGIETFQGTNKLWPVEISDGSLQIDDETCSNATVTSTSVASNGGVVHVVDRLFVPPGAICPDVIFAAEQRSDSRISVYGYDCRNRGFQHLVHGEDKPVGMAYDNVSRTLFWSNDADSPHQSNTSWITAMNVSNTSSIHKIRNKTVDPQGMYVYSFTHIHFNSLTHTHFSHRHVEEKTKKLYFTEHSGYRVSRSNLDGTDYEVLVERPNDNCFQPSDVKVDLDANKIFIYAECPTTDQGTLWVANSTGGNMTLLKSGLVHNYGMCMDKMHQHLFYVQGGSGGSITCMAYGKEPCVKDLVIDGLEWPYMCKVDSTWQDYGGPTIVIFSEANRPGTITSLTTNGTNVKKLKVVTSELDAPMGLELGCLGSDAGMNITRVLV